MNKRIQLIILLSFMISCCFLSSCVKDTDYELLTEIVEKEMDSGARADSLFLGIRLGMTKKEFYGHCWEMNKKGLFTDGEGNTAVRYNLNHNELSEAAIMNFYPDFYQDKIYKVRVSFQYNAWAPWNKHLFAANLQQDVVKLYKTWFPGGNPFIELEDKEKGVIYVKVDGNRRIIVGKFNDVRVNVDFTDLTIEEEIKKQYGEM